MKLLLIDAYNVIRHNPSLALFEEQNGTPSTIGRFVQMCKKAIPKGEHWVVIFDGPGDPQVFEEDQKKLDIFFSKEISADELIIDKARYAVAKGVDTGIASTDFAVYEPGARKISAYDFYDILMTQETERIDAPSTGVTFEHILGEMEKAGHISEDFRPDRRLNASLKQVLDYYGETLSVKANKAAKRIEQILVDATLLTPSPDPEKQIQRKLKEILRR